MSRASIVIVTCAAALVTGLALTGCGATGGSAGSRKPVVFSADSTDGRPVSTAKLRGQPVLLTSWATWCAACREELPRLEHMYEQNRRKGLQAVAVNVDASGLDFRARQLAAGLGLTMPVWADPGNRFSNEFDAVGVPTTVLLDAESRVVHVWQGGLDARDPKAVALVEASLPKRESP